MNPSPHQPPAAPPDPGTSLTPVAPSSDERSMAMLCHLLGIITAYTIGMGFLGPLVLWLIKKDQSPFIDHHGKEALNFQLTFMLVMFLGGIVTFVLLFVFVGILLIPVLIVLGILALVAEILACLAASRGEWHRYPCSIRFVR